MNTFVGTNEVEVRLTHIFEMPAFSAGAGTYEVLGYDGDRWFVLTNPPLQIYQAARYCADDALGQTVSVAENAYLTMDMLSHVMAILVGRIDELEKGESHGKDEPG